jgi:HSP20 family molecular chaperone IbpA
MLLPSIFRREYTDDFMNDFFDFPKRGINEHPFTIMKTDVKELENKYQVMVELPGYTKDEIEVEIVNGYLRIHAEREEETEEKKEDGNYIRKERYVGSCSRRYYIGEDVKQEDVKATFEDGLLQIEVPKKEEHKKEPRKIISID